MNVPTFVSRTQTRGGRGWSKLSAGLFSLAIFLPGSAVSSEGSDGRTLRVETTLQSISGDAELSTGILHELLHTTNYLSAIEPYLVPKSDPGEKTNRVTGGDSFLTLDCDLATANMLSISIEGRDRVRVERTMDRILDHLLALRPGRLETMKQRLEQAVRIADEDRKALEAATEELSRVRSASGGLDPARWLGDLSDRFHNLMLERREIHLKLAVDQEVREHLSTRLSELSSARAKYQTQRARTSDLLDEMNSLQAHIDGIRSRLAQDPRDRQANEEIGALLNRLGTLQKEVATATATATSDNSAQSLSAQEKGRVEVDLLKIERRIAEGAARHRALDASLDSLRDDVLRFRELADRNELARNERVTLAGRVQRNLRDLRDLDVEIAHLDRSVVRVIAGPTEVPSRR